MVNLLPVDSQVAQPVEGASATAEGSRADGSGADGSGAAGCADGNRRVAPRRFGSFVWLFSAGFALGGFKIGLRQLHDNSFFVHLATGRWILDHSAVPHSDVYSFTATGKPFVAQSWLAEALYGFLDRSALGPFGIRVVMAATSAAIAVAVFRIALHESRDRKRATVIGLAAFTVVATMFSERPLGFGLLALAVVVWIVEAPESRLGRRPEVSLPIVMWLWGNVHGSMALGFAYIALHLVGRALDGAPCWMPSAERRLLRAAAISIGVLCINPYGVRILLFPFELLSRGDVLKDVVEWMSPNFHTASGMAFALWLIVALIAMLRGNRPSRRDVIVTIPFLLLSFWALRNLAIATLVMVPIVARCVARQEEPPEPENGNVGRVLGVMILALAGIFAMQALAQPGYDERGYSKSAYRYLEHQGLVGRRLLTTDANAGWMIAAHFPAQRVFMDDRYDMYPREVINDYVTIMRARPDWSRLLTKYHVEVIIWPTDNSLTQLLVLDQQHWTRVYRDKGWTTFVRNDQLRV